MCGSDKITSEDMNVAISRCRVSCYWLSEVDTAHQQLKRVLWFRECYQRNGGPLLCDAIRMSQSSLSTDNRDKIFALLGICPDGFDLLPEEFGYQYPVEVLVMNVTKALIRRTGCLDLILLNKTCGMHGRKAALPDWTPDWLFHGLKKLIS
jgi:hypothetical protein